MTKREKRLLILLVWIGLVAISFLNISMAWDTVIDPQPLPAIPRPAAKIAALTKAGDQQSANDFGLAQQMSTSRQMQFINSLCASFSVKIDSLRLLDERRIDVSLSASHFALLQCALAIEGSIAGLYLQKAEFAVQDSNKRTARLNLLWGPHPELKNLALIGANVDYKKALELARSVRLSSSFLLSPKKHKPVQKTNSTVAAQSVVATALAKSDFLKLRGQIDKEGSKRYLIMDERDGRLLIIPGTAGWALKEVQATWIEISQGSTVYRITRTKL